MQSKKSEQRRNRAWVVVLSMVLFAPAIFVTTAAASGSPAGSRGAEVLATGGYVETGGAPGSGGGPVTGGSIVTGEEEGSGGSGGGLVDPSR